VINREELTDACRRVAILSSVVTHQVKMVLGKDKLTISVNTPDVGEAVEEVPCSFAESQMEIGYNARYLLDILKSMNSEDVQFLLDRNDNAGMVIPEGDGGNVRHQCLLMPLRLTD
jgi:DNA polymerase-3 subunit beta